MSLMNILDALTVECERITGEKCELYLQLPDKVLTEFSETLKPKEKVSLAKAIETDDDESYLVTMYGNGGKIFLLTDADQFLGE
jgi:hypothetical protein